MLSFPRIHPDSLALPILSDYLLVLANVAQTFATCVFRFSSPTISLFAHLEALLYQE